MFVVRYVNGGGGLACLQDDLVNLCLLSYFLHHVDVRVSLDGGLKSWRFTGFYEWSEGFEKVGGTIRPEQYLYAFWDVLSDIGYDGFRLHRVSIYMDNERMGDDLVEKRLDRVVLSLHGGKIFLGSLSHCLHSSSDHLPILLNTEGELVNMVQRGKRIKFESMDEGRGLCEAVHSSRERMVEKHAISSLFTPSGIELSGSKLDDHVLEFYKVMNDFLLQPYNSEEIVQVVKQMHLGVLQGGQFPDALIIHIYLVPR
ncbi:hypothetical protein GH714_028699 [Hevea brasiliensis]|uniref:Uncharacterized protein n=1 Tax=Hevea brasiliensis TaxID=3981 RepID=A0A6A6N948_HEVBR|nr:hypothetical protein GH714_028699 [Hevea brasiliensis]